MQDSEQVSPPDLTPKRNEKGQLLPGETANPTGANGHNAGWQRYGDRIQKWLEMPFVELKALADTPAKFDALSSIDRRAAQHVIDMQSAEFSHRRLSSEDALNRIEGRPTQKVDLITAPFNVTINK